MKNMIIMQKGKFHFSISFSFCVDCSFDDTNEITTQLILTKMKKSCQSLGADPAILTWPICLFRIFKVKIPTIFVWPKERLNLTLPNSGIV